MNYLQILKKTLIVATLMVAVPFIHSCKDKTNETPEVSASPNTVEQNKAALENADPTTTITAEGLNPEHGQPGHRCDIPVGTPLSSPVQNSVPNTTPTPINLNSSSSSGALNPAHGQPGHRCDIKVGEPLPEN